MWRFIACLSAAKNTEWAEKKIKTVPHVFYDSAGEVYMRQYTNSKTYAVGIKLFL